MLPTGEPTIPILPGLIWKMSCTKQVSSNLNQLQLRLAVDLRGEEGLSPEGRNLITDAIRRNDVEFIDEEYLDNNIKKRMDIYKKLRGKHKIKAFINVGGGISVLGSTENDQFNPSGLTKSLPMMNYLTRGVLIRRAENKTSVIHLLNITQLAHKYGLPISPTPLPQPGEGEISIRKQYSMTLAVILTSVYSILIAFVYMMERKRHKLGTELIPDQKTVEFMEV